VRMARSRHELVRKEEIVSHKNSLAPGALFLIALLPAFNLAVFGPLTIYLANTDEFSVTTAGLLVINLLMALGVAMVLTLPGLLLNLPARRIYGSVLFVVGVLLWAQGSFFMHDYGVLDGRGIDWSAASIPGWLDFAFWAVALLLALVLAPRISRIAAFGSTAFILFQAALLGVGLSQIEHGPEAPGAGSADAFPDGIHAYSADRNIVHVVLDNFQTDVFAALVAEQGLEDDFDGFVLYRENTAVAPHTSLAIPAIFSGRIYDGSEPAANYYREAMEHGFHSTLFERGYTVNLIPSMTMRQGPYTNYLSLPKVSLASGGKRKIRDVAFLLDLSLFRQTPHWLRPWFYNQNNWRLLNRVSEPNNIKSFVQRQFFEQYIDTIHVDIDRPAYHFIHLWPPHPPFGTLPSGRWAGRVLDNTRENYTNEARPMTRLLANLVQKLKEIGVYDQSLIIFQSDHGGGFEPDFMPSRLLGMLAVKPAGSRGPMRYSDAPTSVTDVAATILEEVGISDTSIPGKSILGMESGHRIRHFVYFGNDDDRSLHRVVIDGSPYDPDAYLETELITMASESNRYRYGDQVDVGLVGSGGRYLKTGWSAPDDRHVWSNDHSADLLLTVEPTETDLHLAVDLIPHVNGEALPSQRVEILVNGRKALTWVGEEQSKQRLEATLPAEWVDSSQLHIRFVLPDAASPAELGTGGDQRLLGIALIGFQLRQLDSEQ